jgi:hypothetical protein
VNLYLVGRKPAIYKPGGRGRISVTTKQIIFSANLTAFCLGIANFIADFLEEWLGEAYGWAVIH